MNNNQHLERETRWNAALVGVTFIIATAAGSIAAAMTSPILAAPDYLGQIAANEGTILLGAFLNFLMSVACGGVGLGLYPILRRYSVGWAMGATGFRLLESMTQVLWGASLICLLALSREFVTTATPDITYFQTIGAILQTGSEWISNGVTLIFWCIGAFMYYILFYQYRLVPRWLSAWGLAGITLTVITSILVMLGAIPGFGTVQMVANGPIALQEMVFALWLIVKGVNLPGGAR